MPNEQAHPQIARAAHSVTFLRNKLVAGVLVAIPIVVTIWVLNIAYRFITGISAPFLKRIGVEFPGLGFVVTLVLLLALGIISTNVFGKKVLATFERLLMRLPIIATVYNAVKQVIDSFNTFGNLSGFKRVVYIDYPSTGHKLLGFVTGQFYDSHLERDMTSVILPTSPNPMTGLLIIVPTSHVTPSDLSLEEATKLIVSAGLVVPQRARRTAASAAIEEVTLAERN